MVKKRSKIVPIVITTIVILASITVCMGTKDKKQYIKNNITTLMNTTIDIPDGFNVYNRENIKLVECISNKTSKKFVEQYFEYSDKQFVKTMILIPKNEKFQEPNFKIEIKMNCFYWGEDFVHLSYDEFEEEVNSIALREKGITQLQVAETEQVRYAIFTPENNHNEKVFATVFNERLIYFIGTHEGGLTEEQFKVLDDIAMSITLN